MDDVQLAELELMYSQHMFNEYAQDTGEVDTSFFASHGSESGKTSPYAARSRRIGFTVGIPPSSEHEARSA